MKITSVIDNRNNGENRQADFSHFSREELQEYTNLNIGYVDGQFVKSLKQKHRRRLQELESKIRYRPVRSEPFDHEHNQQQIRELNQRR